MRTLEQIVTRHREEWKARALAQQQREIENNEVVARLYGLDGEISSHVPLERISLTNNSAFRWPSKTPEERDALFAQSAVADLISYAVGCIFGRYSLDAPGLILGDQGAVLADYLGVVPHPTFMPDADNVVPLIDGDWFEDDIVDRLRVFLRTVFGEQHLGENLRFITTTLGVKELRHYFVKTAGRGAASKFYVDHVRRYKKRPIYWMFSSPEGSFNALIYLHRYAPSTASTVLTYLREFVTKLDVALAQAERTNDIKEADRLRRVLIELREYEHDVLYPLATENVALNLDDGVRVNYPKLGAALKRIPGLEAADD